MPGWQDAPEVVAAATTAPAWERAPLATPPADMSAVGSMIRGNLGAKVPAPETAHDFLGALEAGLQVSVSGLLARGKAPSIQADPNAPWYNRAAGNVATMAGDVPAMIGGALLGAGAGAETGPGAAITAAAGAFALPAGLRATLMDAYTNGDFKNFGDFWNRASGIMWETTKGWLTGAATGGAGKLAGGVLPAAAPTVVKVAAPTVAELGAMVTVGSALEGHAPAARDFVDAAIVLGGLKGATSLAPKLRQIYAETGKKPAEVVADAKTDRTVVEDMIAPASARIPVETPEFKAFFGDSKAVDGQGKPLVVYHATTADVAAFDRAGRSMFEYGQAKDSGGIFFTSDPARADYYTQGSHGVEPGANVVPAYIRLTNPARIQEHLSLPEQAEALRRAEAAGHDGALIGDTEFVVFRPEQAKSAIGNSGRFDPSSPSLTDPIPRAYAPAAAAERARAIIPGDKAQAVAESPFAEIQQAPGEPAKPTHVNYGLLNTSEDAAGALARLSTIYEQEIQTQRRGTVAWEQTSNEAAKMLSDTLGGVDTKLLMPREPGTPAGAAEILARKQLTIGAAEDMARQAREYQAKGTAASPEDTVAFLASIERAAMIQQEFLGARAEAGRALNILKSTARDAERVKQIQDVMQMYGGDPATLARMIGDMDSAAGALKFAKEALKSTTWEKIVEGWKAGILSGPVTHVANLMGNGIFLAMRAPIDLVASGLGAFRSGPDRVAAVEPLARVLGAVQGSLDGLKVGFHILKTGDLPDIGKAEQHRKAIGGDADSTRAAQIAGEIIRLPYRFLSAEDAVFKSMNSRGEATTLAVRQATNEGLNPLTREFRERVAALVQEPTAKMQEAIDAAADRFTFNSRLGEKGEAVQNFVRAWHLEWAVPFIRTPANIAKELARMTPLAPLVKGWREDIAAGGAARDKAIAEIAVGSATMTAVFMHALQGNVTGAGQPDAGKKRVQQAAGWQPYSVKVGDTYYAYNRLQPIGTLMGLAADAAEMWDHVTEDEADVIPKMLAVAFANAVTNQTFLQGITNVVNAMSDPKRFGPSFLNGFARSAVPNIVGQLTEMNDPVARHVDGMLDAIKSRLPGYRETLLPQRDVFGEPVAGKERMGGLTPVTTSKDSEDKVRSEAARLNISAGDAPKKVHVGRGSGKLGDVPLTPEQRDIFADVSGHLAHDVLTRIVNSSGWDSLPDVVQKKAFAKVFLQAHKAGAAAALPPELRAGIAQEITQKIEAQLAPETTE